MGRGFGRQHTGHHGPLPEGWFRHPDAIKAQIKLAHEVGAAFPPGVLLPHEIGALAAALEAEQVATDHKRLAAAEVSLRWPSKSLVPLKAVPEATPPERVRAVMRNLPVDEARALARLSDQYDLRLGDGYIEGKLPLALIERLMAKGVQMDIQPNGLLRIPVEVPA